MPKSKQQRIAEALTKRGFTQAEVPTRRRWLAFKVNEARTYFVGPNGAVRVGAKISNTVSVTNTQQIQRLLSEVAA